MTGDKEQGWNKPKDDEQDDLAGTELAADPNPDRFVQDGGGKIYRDGMLVEDMDAEE